MKQAILCTAYDSTLTLKNSVLIIVLEIKNGQSNGELVAVWQ